MTKFYGVIGYGMKVQSEPFVFTNVIEEHEASGDVLRNVRTYAEGESVNDKLTLGVNLRVMMDPFLSLNFSHVLYVVYMDVAWKVREVVPEYPAFVLRLGEVYTGDRPEQPTIN